MYLSKTTPRKHQLVAQQKVKHHPSAFAWLMEMGTGKSKVVLDEFGDLEDKGLVENLLIIAPAGAYGNWCRVDDLDPGEIQKHVPDSLRKRLWVTQWISGKKMKPNWGAAPRCLVMNVEALSVATTGAREMCLSFLKSGRTMMVIDESTAVKNPKAKRTKYILKLGALAAYRRIATGLVAPRSPLDLYTQFEFLDWSILGFKSFYTFRERYAKCEDKDFGGRKVRIPVYFRNVEELQQKIAPYSYRVLKEDCLDLEPKNYASRDISMTDEQQKIYRELKANATAALGNNRFVTATQVITQILRLDQVLCGHVTDEEGILHDIPERRIAALLDVLREHSGKAIIWTAWDHCVKKITKAIEADKDFGKGSVAQFWGGNRNTRSEDEARFKSDPDCRFMVSTPGAGGKGNTWVVADLVIYHSSTNNLEHRAQSEDRAHRDGQCNIVHYVDLVARGTVDEKKLKALRAKIDMSTVINGDNYREWLV